MSTKEAGHRLGRGLAALLAEAGSDAPLAAPASGGVQSIPIDLIEPGPYQPRGPIDPDSLSELVHSVRTHGVLQPLLLRPHPGAASRYQIIAGERRWRAAQAAGLHEVPALVRPLDDAEAMAAALVENLQRQDLNPLEEAQGYQRLLEEFGMTQEALGDAVGKSRSHIANTLRLLNLPPTVQAELRNGALTAGHARALLGHPDPAKAALSVIAQGLNVRQTEALVAHQAAKAEHGEGSGKGPEKDPETAALEHDLSERLGLKVEIRFDGKGGSVRIHYRSLDQLDGLVALLNRG